jgi:hypothetical protein
LECGGKHSAPHRGRLRRPLVATALKPLLIFSARGTRLEGGNRGVQKCDSVDPLSLVIKCLGGGGHELEDSIVRTFGKRPLSPGDQVNTHSMTLQEVRCFPKLETVVLIPTVVHLSKFSRQISFEFLLSKLAPLTNYITDSVSLFNSASESDI